MQLRVGNGELCDDCNVTVNSDDLTDALVQTNQCLIDDTD